MKRTWSIFLFLCCYQPLLMSHSYIDSLDLIIDQKLKAVASELSADAVAVSEQINKAIDSKISLQDLHDLLQSNKFFSFFLLESSINVKEIKFALGAKIYLYCLDCCEQKMLHKSGKNQDSIDYWEHELFYEKRDLFQKNIIRWTHRESYKKTIQSNIDHLESISKQTFYFLGLIRHSKQILLEASNRELFEKNLMMSVRLQDIFLNAVERDYDVCDVYHVITAMVQQSHDFSENLSVEYTESQPPHHFERNWVAYSSAAVTLCACLATYYAYQNDVDALIHASYQSGISFWDTKVKKPATEMFNTLSGGKNEPLLNTAREEKILETLLIQGDNAPAPQGAGVSDVTVIVNESYKLLGQAGAYVGENLLGYKKENAPEVVAPLVGSADNNVQPYAAMSLQEQEALRLRVAAKDGVVLAYPKANLNEAFPALERTALSPIVELQRAMNDLYAENQFVVSLIAMFPVVLLARGAMFASKKAYSMTLYKPISRVIRDLEIFLNDSITKPISFDREGRLYFLTESLKRNSGALMFQDSKLMEDDIAELQSKHLTYLQKFNIVQRMYHTYAFLLPGAV